MKKKLELVEKYQHNSLSATVLPDGTTIIHSAYFEKLMKFYPATSVEELEICMKALGFTKED